MTKSLPSVHRLVGSFYTAVIRHVTHAYKNREERNGQWQFKNHKKRSRAMSVDKALPRVSRAYVQQTKRLIIEIERRKPPPPKKNKNRN